ncbi:MAG: GNAT family N-acetyltransferase [Candidatus Brockarchaeota archaeon]|nr:GNAT family N-acetyltransferase [Candidatus Brockarchaeota archaeon]MBO3809089.1 GNAT family N-acetyltransferase [Candidatus Brockarchaeota archaeon]
MLVKIYECKPEDLDESLKQLWLSLAREMFKIERFILPSEENADKWISFIRDTLVRGKSFLFLAKIGNKPIGFCTSSIFETPLEVSEPMGSINDLYVLPEFRRRGVGRKLMVESLRKLKAKGVEAIRLSVLKENKAAVRLYEKLGFKIYQYGMEKTFRKSI